MNNTQHQEGQDEECCCWLLAPRPSNMLVYLRDGSAQPSVRAATLRQKVADHACCLTQSQITDTPPTSPIADAKAPGGVATEEPMLKSPECLHLGNKTPTTKAGIEFRGRYHGGRRPSSDDSFHSPTVVPPSALDKPMFVGWLVA